MGEVYRARDPRIGRDVAIKILPPALVDDADRLRRFEQEARATGTLPEPADDINPCYVTPDGQTYAYSFRRFLSDLYVVSGL